MMTHLTPMEVARKANMDRRSVILNCMTWGVPIYDGRIIWELFETAMEKHACA